MIDQVSRLTSDGCCFHLVRHNLFFFSRTFIMFFRFIFPSEFISPAVVSVLIYNPSMGLSALQPDGETHSSMPWAADLQTNIRISTLCLADRFKPTALYVLLTHQKEVKHNNKNRDINWMTRVSYKPWYTNRFNNRLL